MVTRAARSAAIALMMLTMSAVAATVAAAESKAILVVHTYGYEAPGRVPFDAALVRTFREATSVPVDLYIETLDAGRFGEPEARQTRAYLRAKYGGRRIAVLVAVYDAALAFLLDPADPLFPGVPVAAVSIGSAPTSERASVIVAGSTTGESVALALKLHPGTKQIAIINGLIGGGGGDAAQDETRRQAETISARLPVTFLHAQELDQLRADVQALPRDTLILISRLTVRTNGQPISNTQAAQEISRAARVPVYVISDNLVGSGPVGGVVIRIESQASQLALIALKLAAGAQRLPPAQSIPVPMFDWRELRRWGISEALLPAGSIIQFRQLSVWDRYKVYILGTVAIVALQSALIAGLVVQAARLRRTERELRDSESALRVSGRELRALAGRLIVAQEAERARIARELHDDLSQQLALLSIEIDQFVIRSGGGNGMMRHAHAAATHVADIATSVHNLSHDLHPARLEMLGLGPALRSLCRDMSAAHSLPIDFEEAPIPGAIPGEVTLCLFRVVQEALRNVVKHSAARTAQVQLRHADGMLELQIVDTGRGFSLEVARDGIGLVSMRERVHFTGGEIVVHSSVGTGTRIRVRVPVAASDTASAGAVRSAHDVGLSAVRRRA